MNRTPHGPAAPRAGLVLLLLATLWGWSWHSARSAAAREAVADSTIPLSFAVAPGRPLLQHLPLQRSFSLAAARGQTIADWVAILNLSATTPQAVRLQALDGVTPPSGAGISFDEGAAQHQIGLWTKLGTTRVVVPPGQFVVVPLWIRVPATARPGEYEGAITATSEQAVTVTTGGRHYLIHGTRRCLVALRISGPATAGLAITSVQLVTRPSTALALTVRNTGTVVIRPVSTRILLAGTSHTVTLQAAVGPISGGAATVVSLGVRDHLAAGLYHLSVAMTYRAQIRAAGPPQQMRSSWQGAMTVPRGAL